MTATEKERNESFRDFTVQEIAQLKKRLEWEIFQAVLARLRAAVLVVASLFTVFGLATLATIRSAIVDVAANKIAIESSVREQVVSEATSRLEKVNAVLQKAAALDERVDAEEARAMALIKSDLERVLGMMQQLEAEISARSSVEPNARP